MDRMAPRRCRTGIAFLCLFLGLPAASPSPTVAAVQADSSQALIEQGTVLLRQGNVRGAEEAAKKAIQQYPSSAEAHHLLGLIYVKARKPIEAVDAFTHALKLKPAYPEALNDLAEVYLVQGKSAEAEQALRRAIEINPKHAESYLDLAKLYEQRRDLDGAKKLYLTLLNTVPGQQDALFELAALYDTQGEAKAARDTLRRLTRANPKHASAWYLSGRIAERNNDLVEAAYAYKQAIAAKPDLVD